VGTQTGIHSFIKIIEKIKEEINHIKKGKLDVLEFEVVQQSLVQRICDLEESQP
jgi:hypothetical protein